MNASITSLQKKLPLMTELDRRMFNGLIKTANGEITQDQFRGGFQKLFEPQMMDLYSRWMKSDLFRCQKEVTIEAFVLQREDTIRHDHFMLYQFGHVGFLTQQDNFDEFRKVERFAQVMVKPSLRYRQQFLNEDGEIDRSPSEPIRRAWAQLNQRIAEVRL